MKLLVLALNDITQIFRDRKSLLFLVAMPIVFTLFMGVALGAGGDSSGGERLSLAWVDPEPNALLNQRLQARLAGSDVLSLTPMTEEASLDGLARGKVDGVLIIPAGFSEQAMNGKPVQLTLMTDPASAKGQTLYRALSIQVAQLMSAVTIAQLDMQVNGPETGMAPATRAAQQRAAFERAWGAWSAAGNQPLVKTEQAVVQAAAAPYGGNPYNQSSPGILVQFAVFGLVASAQVLVQERKTRTLQRLMTTAMRPAEIVAGHMLAMFAIVFLQTVLLVAFGQLFLKVNYLHEPVAILVVSLALGIWVASMGLLIGVWARGEDQVVLYSLFAMFLFSALGGAWFPLEGAGKVFATVGYLTPAAWAINGYQNVLLRGLGLGSVALPAAILLAYSAAFFLLAVWRFRQTV